jgi:putative FmdB family regulatory protein
VTYEYVCQECGHRWEAEQKITAEPLTDCPMCGDQGKGAAKRLISGGTGHVLVGDRWARDGYGKY